MTAITAPATTTHVDRDGNRDGRASLLTEVVVLTGRNLLKIVRVPQLLFFSLVQPILFLTLFSQVFQGLAKTPELAALHVKYIDYLLPAILIVTVAQNAVQSAVGIATDMNTGVIDRFRSLPISRGSVLVARSVSDVLRSTVQTLIMVVLGMAVFGFRFHANVVEALAMLIISSLFAWSMTWIFLALGVRTRNPETAQVAGFMLLFPLMFASSAFVPVQSLPGWMQAVSKVNPLSYLCDATRALALGWSLTPSVWKSLLAIAIVAVLGIVATATSWRRLARP
jgi:ABC-2 type transport system permease protein